MIAEKVRVTDGEVPGHLLVVDDEALIRWAASSTLSDAGYEVAQAADGAEARRQSASKQFDLALLDLRLPDTDGLTLMRDILTQQPQCRFIVMTAFRTPELTANASATGVPVLDKPFSMPDMLRLVDDVLHHHGI
jgi:DNA-binding NtrC family response regulator